MAPTIFLGEHNANITSHMVELIIFFWYKLNHGNLATRVFWKSLSTSHLTFFFLFVSRTWIRSEIRRSLIFVVATSLEAKGAIILELRQELKGIGECTYGHIKVDQKRWMWCPWHHVHSVNLKSLYQNGSHSP